MTSKQLKDLNDINKFQRELSRLTLVEKQSVYYDYKTIIGIIEGASAKLVPTETYDQLITNQNHTLDFIYMDMRNNIDEYVENEELYPITYEVAQLVLKRCKMCLQNFDYFENYVKVHKLYSVLSKLLEVR